MGTSNILKQSQTSSNFFSYFSSGFEGTRREGPFLSFLIFSWKERRKKGRGRFTIFVNRFEIHFHFGLSKGEASWHACTKWNNRAGERVLRSGASLETPRRMHLHSSTLPPPPPPPPPPFATLSPPLLASPLQEISMQPGVLIDGEQCSRPQRLC